MPSSSLELFLVGYARHVTSKAKTLGQTESETMYHTLSDSIDHYHYKMITTTQ
jgi:hypothetical protein